MTGRPCAVELAPPCPGVPAGRRWRAP
jgi:hypothetical protein